MDKKWLYLCKGYIQIGVGEFIYIRLGYESEKEPADTDAVVISDCWGSRSAIPTNKEQVNLFICYDYYYSISNTLCDISYVTSLMPMAHYC